MILYEFLYYSSFLYLIKTDDESVLRKLLFFVKTDFSCAKYDADV